MKKPKVVKTGAKQNQGRGTDEKGGRGEGLVKSILMRFNYILTINNPFLYTWPRDSGALNRIDDD
jgi:hypothetical protein